MTFAALLIFAAADGPAAALEADIRKVVAAVEPSVVALVVSHADYKDQAAPAKSKPGTLGAYTPRATENRIGGPQRDLLDLSDHRNIPDNHYGTGLVIDPAGLILTNFHVVEGASKVFVRLPGGKGAYADIHAADGRSDLAVLRLRRGFQQQQPVLKPVKFADVQMTGPKAVARGQFVVAVAHPFAAGAADGQASVSFGLISNVRRRVFGLRPDELRNQHLHQFDALLQTDARLNLGCSGGALLNLDGEVIGVITATAGVAGSEAAGGFALPMTTNFRRIVDRLRQGREVEYGFLGVTLGRASDDPPGLAIEAVTGNGPAQAAGLDRNDIIQAVNGEPIRDADDLFLHVGSAHAGTPVSIRYSRGGVTRTAQRVVLAKYLHTFPAIASNQPDAVHGLRVEYASIRLQQNLNGRMLGLAHEGVVVRELEPMSPAEEKFKGLGADVSVWVITAVNGTSVRTPDEFYAACRRGGKVELTVANATNRTDREREIVLP